MDINAVVCIGGNFILSCALYEVQRTGQVIFLEMIFMGFSFTETG